MRPLLTKEQRDAFDAKLTALRKSRKRAKSDARKAEIQAEIDAVKSERKAARQAEGRARTDAGTRWWQQAARGIDAAVNQQAMLDFANAERDDAIQELGVLATRLLATVGDDNPDDLAQVKALVIRAVTARVRDIVQDMADQADVFTDFTAIPWPTIAGFSLAPIGQFLEVLDGPLYRYIAHRNEARLRSEILGAIFPGGI